MQPSQSPDYFAARLNGLRKNLSEALISVRARLQSCRKSRIINAGFSPCGMVFELLTSESSFFRNLCKYPPAEPGALCFVAPQRGLAARDTNAHASLKSAP